MIQFYLPVIIQILFIVGVGFLIYLAVKKRDNSKEIIQNLNREIQEITDTKSRIEGNSSALQENLKKSEDLIVTLQKENKILNIQVTENKGLNSNLQEKLSNQKQEIEELQKKFTDAFENLANRIFEDKSKKFNQENRQNIDEILKPLKERIKEFEQKVDLTHRESLKNNISLVEQIKNIEKINKQISDDANNLTKALKGDVKIQGNWGEVILARILEESGLQKDLEYESQSSFTTEDGKRLQPDVIVKLPENKHLIIDSKVSLVSYEKLIAADSEDQQQHQMKALISSVKAHIDGLHKKHYHDLKELNTPDFVMLFMPIEGSFTIVAQNDQTLYSYALEKHIVIVSPSTLLATLRTIAFIWRQENQTKNALEIARQSGNLYDAIMRTLDDVEKIGTSLDKATASYQQAVKHIKTGRGNLVGRVEKIKKLGAKANKTLSQTFAEEADGE